MTSFCIQTRSIDKQRDYRDLAIFINDLCATDNKKVPVEGASVDEAVSQHIVCDPRQLAQWFAANWWRLRWETEKDNLTQDDQIEWDMSHKLPAAGGGFTWPNIAFSSDNDSVLCVIKPTTGTHALIQFLQNDTRRVTADQFEAGLDAFVNNVTQSFATGDDLSRLWEEVKQERVSPEISQWRKLEAKAGFDPDEAPDALIESFIRLGENYGEASIAELVDEKLASPADDIAALISNLRKSQDTIRADLLHDVDINKTKSDNKPWQAASIAARQVRICMGNKATPITNTALGEFMGLSERILKTASRQKLPSAGLVDGKTTHIRLSGGRATSRRFGLCRLLADKIYTANMPKERILPAVDSRSVRQKFQRAFAQELLCPAEALFSWMDTTSPNDELCEKAANHFQVSPLTVKYTLENHSASW